MSWRFPAFHCLVWSLLQTPGAEPISLPDVMAKARDNSAELEVTLGQQNKWAGSGSHELVLADRVLKWAAKSRKSLPLDLLPNIQKFIGDGVMIGDAGVASQNQIDPIGQHPLESRDFDPVRLGQAIGDMVANFRSQVLQGGDKQSRRGLPIDIEVAPNADRFLVVDGLCQTGDGYIYVGQYLRRGWLVVVRIKESACLLYCSQATLRQELRQQRVVGKCEKVGGDIGCRRRLPVAQN